MITNFPMLNLLNDEHILEVELRDTCINIREGCDGYYAINLDKQQVQQLIHELQQLLEQIQ